MAVNRRNVLFLLFTIVGFIADQASKQWIVANLALGEQIEIIPGWFAFEHAQNPGAAFGMLGSFAYRHWVFLVFTLVAGAVILDMFRKLPPSDWLMSSALGLILSGALGNAIDRARQQYVTDFLKVETDIEPIAGLFRMFTGTNAWPNFNIADAALVVGVGLFIVHHLFFEEAAPKEGEAPGAEAPGAQAATPPSPDEDDIPTDKEPALRPVSEGGSEAP